MNNIFSHSVIIIIGALYLPSPSRHHFIWPLSSCLLADICNHTWIPECGREVKEHRLFIDECDMYEYNCDYEREFELVNYSDCFMGVSACPHRPKCPSRPTCKDHRFHRMGDHYIVASARRRMPPFSLPMHMLHGKRRYTPKPGKKKIIVKRRSSKRTTRKMSLKQTYKQTLKPTTKKPILEPTMQSVILKRETIFRNGKKLLRVVKGFAWQPGKPLKIVAEEKDSEFLE